ncbi:DUF5316 family protein [Oxobacter pfennigii]|nr:DUF5316 family protein [Oxobacter pfennigii]
MYIKIFVISIAETAMVYATLAIFNKSDMLVTTLGIIGAILLFISSILSGALVSGNRMRLNHAVEDKNEMQNKKTIQVFTFILGLMNVFACLIIYFSSKPL